MKSCLDTLLKNLPEAALEEMGRGIPYAKRLSEGVSFRNPLGQGYNVL